MAHRGVSAALAFGLVLAAAPTAGASTPDSGPTGIAAGSDGSLWFTESPGGLEPVATIGRITTAGVVTEFPVAGTQSANGIVAGPDGALWFTEIERGAIGRITTAGSI